MFSISALNYVHPDVFRFLLFHFLPNLPGNFLFVCLFRPFLLVGNGFFSSLPSFPLTLLMPPSCSAWVFPVQLFTSLYGFLLTLLLCSLLTFGRHSPLSLPPSHPSSLLQLFLIIAAFINRLQVIYHLPKCSQIIS